MDNDKYHWLNAASGYHKSRMLQLGRAEELVGDVRGEKDEKYMRYLLTSIDHPDGGRRYEFLIEYDIFNPSQGVYFGCKSLTLPAHRHSVQIRRAQEDWQRAMPFVIQRLNNIFVDKDFTYRFRDSDNDNNGTFWPFWISLYEDEDPRQIGVRALENIATVYRQLISGSLPTVPPAVSGGKTTAVRTAFTEEAYDALRESIRKTIRTKTGLNELADQGWELFETFLRRAESEGIIIREESYERAWCPDSGFGDVDFKCMMQFLFDSIAMRIGIENLGVPWESLLKIFMRPDGTTYKVHLKTLTPKAITRRLWRDTLHRLVHE